MKRNFPLWTCVGLFAVPGLLACAGSNFVGTKFVKAELVTASMGGTVKVSESEEPTLKGLELEVPPGALSADTKLSVETMSTPIAKGATEVGPVAIWGPAGTKFSTPAQMKLPFKLPTGANVADLFIQVEEEDGTRSEISGSDLSIDMTTGLVRFGVKHFTAFQACMRNPDAGTRSDGGVSGSGGTGGQGGQGGTGGQGGAGGQGGQGGNGGNGGNGGSAGTDAGVADAGPADGGTQTDGGTPTDAGTQNDGGTADAGPSDGGTQTDGGAPTDAGTPNDGGTADGGTDAGASDGGPQG